MPVRAADDAGGRFTIVSISDPYTIEEWREAILGAWNSHAFVKNGAILIDRRSAEPPSVQFVEAITAFLADHRDKIAGSRAAILAEDDGGFGMGRMTQLKSRLQNPDAFIQAFRNYDEAVAWLTG